MRAKWGRKNSGASQWHKDCLILSLFFISTPQYLKPFTGGTVYAKGKLSALKLCHPVNTLIYQTSSVTRDSNIYEACWKVPYNISLKLW